MHFEALLPREGASQSFPPAPIVASLKTPALSTMSKSLTIKSLDTSGFVGHLAALVHLSSEKNLGTKSLVETDLAF